MPYAFQVLGAFCGYVAPVFFTRRDSRAGCWKEKVSSSMFQVPGVESSPDFAFIRNS
jgi:hypothetical protein